MSNFLLSQILVGCALITDVASFQFRRRKIVLSWLIGSCILIATHFVLLQRYTAAAIVCVTGVRFLTSILTQNKNAMWFFFAANLSCFIYTYESAVSVLPFIAAMLSTWAGFQPSDKALRLVFASATCLWIAHNIIVWTPVGVFIECVFLCSNLIGFYRYYLKNAESFDREINQSQV